MTQGISREAYERLMVILSQQQTTAADKFKECLGAIDKECQDLRIYVWVSKGRELMPVYPRKDVADFNMLEELAEGMLHGEGISPSSVGRGSICGEKIDGVEEGSAILVLVEKWKKGMLPAGPFNPYHDIYAVMDVIKRVCKLLKPIEQFEELKKKSNILELPDKIHLLEDIRDGASVPMIGIVSMADAEAVLDAGGYFYTGELLRKWVASTKELAGDDVELFYCSDSSFIIACTGSPDEGLAVLKQLPERLSKVRLVSTCKRQLITLTAKAKVVAVQVLEEYSEAPSQMLRKALKYRGMVGSFQLFKEATEENNTDPTELFEQFELLGRESDEKLVSEGASEVTV